MRLNDDLHTNWNGRLLWSTTFREDTAHHKHKQGRIRQQEITWHGTRYCRLLQLTHYTRQRLRRTHSSVRACGCHCANVDDSAPAEP